MSSQLDFWSAEMDPDTPTLDVHGLTISEAIESVSYFIDRSLTGQYRIVKIVHGRGKGVLRRALLTHLRSVPHVIKIQGSKRLDEAEAVTYIMLK